MMARSRMPPLVRLAGLLVALPGFFAALAGAESSLLSATSSPMVEMTQSAVSTPATSPAETTPVSVTPTCTDAAPTATSTGSPTSTPSRPATPTPTFTPTSTSVAYDRTAVRLNEVLPRPAKVDWDGDGNANAEDEWVELYNLSQASVDLSLWLLDDIPDGGSSPYVFPRGTILAPGAFLVIHHRVSGVALNNDADTVRLLGPDSTVADTFAYANPRPDQSYSRTTDGEGSWTEAYPPSPGRPNLPPSPTATPTPTGIPTPYPAGITLNEILPDPEQVDWDGDGTASEDDEWIELYNAGDLPASLAGWALMDNAKGYTLPVGSLIEPRGYLVFLRVATHLALNNDGDRVVLSHPDGSTADRFDYAQGPGADRSYCRSIDGGGTWTRECQVTRGGSNLLLPTPTPRPTSVPGSGGSENQAQPGKSSADVIWASTIAAARALSEGDRVTFVGGVTLPPGLFGRRIYLQDDTGGVRVYLRRGDYPPVDLGDRLQVTGTIDDYHGEFEVVVADAGGMARLGSGVPTLPQRVSTGQVDEAHESQLVWVAGRVTKHESGAWILDDGSGPARVYFPEDLPWRRPYVQVGEVWSVQGVVSQYASVKPYVGGYRLVPRFITDVGLPPSFLPVTGRGF